MPAKRLKEFLDSQNVRYVMITHSPAYTAQEIAANAHISGRNLAKTVMIKINGAMAMAVLPANQKVILQDLREMIGTDDITFASEDEFKKMFPDCETGAMPPMGNLYGMEVYVAPTIAEEEEIAFNAGTHTELVKMAYRDFERLVHPKVASFTT